MKKRTRHSLDNARVYITGQDIESRARAKAIGQGKSQKTADKIASAARAVFERACVETADRNDRAHGKTFSDGIPGLAGWLVPGGLVEGAKFRRYPRACVLEVRIRRRGLAYISHDTECESIGDRAARLSAAGIPVGYVGSVTGAQQQRARGPKDESTLAYVESVAARSGKTLRDLLRPRTRVVRTAEERALEAEASRLIAQAEGVRA